MIISIFPMLYDELLLYDELYGLLEREGRVKRLNKSYDCYKKISYIDNGILLVIFHFFIFLGL